MRTEQEIDFDRAREIAIGFLTSHIPEFLTKSYSSFLEESYVEHEDCWIFYRNKNIIIPRHSGRIGADWAYAIGKLGGVMLVPDHSGNEIELTKQLEYLSKYFRTHDAKGSPLPR